MSGSRAFLFACEELERATVLDRLEARGTVRIALRDAGFEPKSVKPGQMAAVLAQVLPPELEKRGVAGAKPLCARIAAGLDALPAEDVVEAPEAIFARLGGAPD